jgi:hypothetical protein
MSHKDLTTYTIEIPPNASDEDMEWFSNAMAEEQNEFLGYIEKTAAELGIDEGSAADICYLRTRARWTQEKEDYLVKLAKAEKPFPSMLEDFEVPNE